MTDDSDHDTRPEPTDHRMLGILLALVAIAALGYSLVSQRWLLSPSGGVGFGLRTNHVCYRVGEGEEMRCDELSNSDYVGDRADAADEHERDGVSTVFPWLGWGTSALVGISVLGLLVTVIVAALGKRPHLFLSPTTVALAPAMIAMITGCLFCATKPGETSFVGVAIGFWVFGAGEICALISGLLLARSIRPPDQDLAAGAMDPDEF
jgi:hypothetical protein